MKSYKILLVILSVTLVSITFADGRRLCGTQEAFERFQRGEKLLRPPNGPYFIYAPHFIIHYDTTGVNACTRIFAESTAFFAEYAWAKFIGGLGFIATPPDTGGPDSRYDIYIRSLPPPSYGYAYMDSPFPVPYPDGMTSYIAILNTQTWNDLRYTVVHEFFHGVQFRYSSEYSCWYENCATLMEQVSEVPGWDSAWWVQFWFTWVTTNPLTYPNYPIISTTNLYEYTGYLWPRFLCDYYSTTTQRLIWEKIGEVTGPNVFSAIDTVLKLYDSNLTTALVNYGVWRYFTGSRADTIHYFKESHLMPTSYVDPAHCHQGPGSGNHGAYPPIGPGGTNFIEFYTTPDYLLKNSFIPNGYAEWQVSNIGFSRVFGHKQYLMDTIDFWSVLPTMAYDTFVLIPTVTDLWNAIRWYFYSGSAISSNPTPPQNPELQVCSIISPRGIVLPYSNVTPRSIRRNNGTSAVDSTWTSFYIGNIYSDSRKIGPLNPGQTDTITFTGFTIKERKSFDVRCVAGSSYDVNRANNCCTTSVFIPLTDFEVLEILAPRGAVTQNITVTPRVLIRNNSTSGSSVSATLNIGSYTDTRSLYLGPGQSGEFSFNNFTPSQLGMCTTRCYITTTDQRPFNNTLHGEILVVAPPSIIENNNLVKLPFKLDVAPNPFNMLTTIRYTLPIEGRVSLLLYDVSGRLVKTLVNGQKQPGNHTITLNSKSLSAGIHFLTLETQEKRIIERLIVIK